jgi:aminoglycoside phosphotransferase (APT) family kinase protein
VTVNTDLAEQVLDVLRAAAGEPGLTYDRRPEPMHGGFWAELCSFSLAEPPAGWPKELVARLMPDPGAARKETIVQTAVAAAGFPTPAVRASGGTEDGLGRAFMIMDRAPGGPLLAGLDGAGAVTSGLGLLSRIPVVLATAMARLHALDPNLVRAELTAAAAADPSTGTPAATASGTVGGSASGTAGAAASMTAGGTTGGVASGMAGAAAGVTTGGAANGTAGEAAGGPAGGLPDRVGYAPVTVPGLISVMAGHAAEFGRADLAGAAQWLTDHAPAAVPDVICHGDLHPFNLLADGDLITVLDWSTTLIGPRAHDVAFTSLLLSEPPLDVPGWARPPVRALGRLLARRFVRAYQRSAGVRIGAGELRYHQSVVCLRALTEVAGWVHQGAAGDRAGHPWLVCGPAFARRLSRLTGVPVRPR